MASTGDHSIVFKVQTEASGIRRVRLSPPLTMAALNKALGFSASFSYTDDEGDVVTLITDADLVECAACFVAQGLSVARLTAVAVAAPSASAVAAADEPAFVPDSSTDRTVEPAAAPAPAVAAPVTAPVAATAEEEEVIAEATPEEPDAVPEESVVDATPAPVTVAAPAATSASTPAHKPETVAAVVAFMKQLHECLGYSNPHVATFIDMFRALSAAPTQEHRESHVTIIRLALLELSLESLVPALENVSNALPELATPAPTTTSEPAEAEAKADDDASASASAAPEAPVAPPAPIAAPAPTPAPTTDDFLFPVDKRLPLHGEMALYVSPAPESLGPAVPPSVFHAVLHLPVSGYYIVMQVLTSNSDGSTKFWLWSRCDRPGTNINSELKGPFDRDTAVQRFQTLFNTKTGVAFVTGSLWGNAVTPKGKFDFLPRLSAEDADNLFGVASPVATVAAAAAAAAPAAPSAPPAPPLVFGAAPPTATATATATASGSGSGSSSGSSSGSESPELGPAPTPSTSGSDLNALLHPSLPVNVKAVPQRRSRRRRNRHDVPKNVRLTGTAAPPAPPVRAAIPAYSFPPAAAAVAAPAARNFAALSASEQEVGRLLAASAEEARKADAERLERGRREDEILALAMAMSASSIQPAV